MLVCSGVFVGLVYTIAVLTPQGQAIENAALRGADQVSNRDFDEASAALDQITIWSLAVATLAVGLIGLLRRRPKLGVIAVGVIFVGQMLTQSLKRFILPRPELVAVSGDFTGNSFPSGHTTIAMTVLIAMFLVVPYRARALTVGIVSLWAVGIGAYTLTAKWHRLSDTLGADLIALALGAAATIVLLRFGMLRRVKRRMWGQVGIIIFWVLTGFVALTLGAILLSAAVRYPLTDPLIEWDVYLGAHAIAIAGSLFVAIVFWVSWLRIDTVPSGFAQSRSFERVDARASRM